MPVNGFPLTKDAQLPFGLRLLIRLGGWLASQVTQF